MEYGKSIPKLSIECYGGSLFQQAESPQSSFGFYSFKKNLHFVFNNEKTSNENIY